VNAPQQSSSCAAFSSRHRYQTFGRAYHIWETSRELQTVSSWVLHLHERIGVLTLPLDAKVGFSENVRNFESFCFVYPGGQEYVSYS